MKYYMGIDPGASGAVVVIDQLGRFVALRDLGKSPEDIVAAFAGLLVEANGVANIAGMPLVAIIERVSSSPQMGRASAFTFGGSYYSCMTVLAWNSIAYHQVPPAKWKSDMGVTASGVPKKDRLKVLKAKSLALARQIFPAASLERKKDEGRAEALLIAEWGRRQGR